VRDDGFREAQRITRHYAGTFYAASRFLDARSRRAAYAVYAVCRIADESVDAAATATAVGAPAQRLDEVRRSIEGAYGTGHLDNPLFCAFRETVQSFAIPKDYFFTLLEGMRLDTQQNRYTDFNALYEYCYRAAGVVGLIMVKIFGARNERKAAECAVSMGIAMQLTNILRDIKEDSCRGRIYLPQDELKKFGVTEQDIMRGALSQGFRDFVSCQIERCRAYYSRARAGIPLLASRRARIVAQSMGVWYEAILDEIVRSGYDVFSRRASVPLRRKLATLPGILLGNTARQA
jgi:phytoene synthase